jgi:hypothetical protein
LRTPRLHDAEVSCVVSLLTLSVAAAAFVAFVILAYLRRWSWTGFVAQPSSGGKTFWDWLQLLIVPLVLAVAAFWLNDEQSQRDEARETRCATTSSACRSSSWSTTRATGPHGRVL